MTHISTIRELIAKATPGPWKARRRSPDDDGFVQADEPTKPYGTEILGEDYFQHRSRAADVDYIARLSPDTVLAVVEALEIAQSLIGPHNGPHAYQKVSFAISLLNGSPVNK